MSTQVYGSNGIRRLDGGDCDGGNGSGSGSGSGDRGGGNGISGNGRIRISTTSQNVISQQVRARLRCANYQNMRLSHTVSDPKRT